MARENKIYMQKYCLRGFWEGGRTESTRNVFLEKAAQSLRSQWGRGPKTPSPPNILSCTSNHHDDHRRDKLQLEIRFFILYVHI